MALAPSEQTKRLNSAWLRLKDEVAETMHDVCKLELLQKMFEKWSLDKLEGLFANLSESAEAKAQFGTKRPNYETVLEMAKELREYDQHELIEELGFEVKDFDDHEQDRRRELVTRLMPKRVDTVNELSALELLMRAYKQLTPQQIEALLSPVLDENLRQGAQRTQPTQIMGTPFVLHYHPQAATA